MNLNVTLLVNDGSFMERFKQLQQEKEKDSLLEGSKSVSTVSGTSISKPIIGKTSLEFKANGSCKTTVVASGGELSFSLKQKSKLIPPPVKLGEDEDEDEEDAGNLSGNELEKWQKLGQTDTSKQSLKQVDVGVVLPFHIFWCRIPEKEKDPISRLDENLYKEALTFNPWRDG